MLKEKSHRMEELQVHITTERAELWISDWISIHPNDQHGHQRWSVTRRSWLFRIEGKKNYICDQDNGIVRSMSDERLILEMISTTKIIVLRKDDQWRKNGNPLLKRMKMTDDLIKKGGENERHSSSSKLFDTYEKQVDLRKASGRVDWFRSSFSCENWWMER